MDWWKSHFARMLGHPAPGVYGAVFLELQNTRTRGRRIFVGRNHVLNRGVDAVLTLVGSRLLGTAQSPNGPGSPGVSRPGGVFVNPFSHLVASTGTAAVALAESDADANASAGVIVRAIPISLRAPSLSGFTEGDLAFDLVFVRNPSDAFLDGLAIGSVGFAAGPDAGTAAGTYGVATTGGDGGGAEALVAQVAAAVNSQWGTRILLGTPAQILIDSGVADVRPLLEQGGGASLVYATDYDADSDADTPATPGRDAFDLDTGDIWRSDDVATGHWLQRTWGSTSYLVSDITIIAPYEADGGNPSFDADEVPDIFSLELETSPGVWESAAFSRVSDGAYYPGSTTVGQSGAIIAGAAAGEVYRLEFPTRAYGVRLAGIQNDGGDPAIGTRVGVGEVSVLVADETPYVVNLGVNDVLRLQGNGDPFVAVTVPAGTYSAEELSDAVNALLLPLDEQVEAFHDGLNRFGLRTRAIGAATTVDADSVANGSTLNPLVGFGAAGESGAGATTPVTKNPLDHLTLVYRIGVVL